MEYITSVNNNLIKNTCKLHQKKYRDESKSFLIEGEHLVEEANKLNLLKMVFVRSDLEKNYHYDNMIICTKEVMNKLSDTVSTIGIIGVCKYLEEKKDLGNKIVILDGVQDPGNLGTIIRTSLSFGYNDLIVSNNTCDLYNEKVVRSTQGSLFSINYIRKDLKDAINDLKKRGYSVYGTSLRNAKGLKSFDKKEKIALVFGNEGNGVTKEILDLCDENIFIEMETFESLNVAIACGIVLYYFK